MIKIMKYEFRKQLFTKFVMLGVMGIVELYFLYGIFKKDETKIGISIMLLVLATIAILTFVAFESINTFSRDLKTKQSYMLFLVPKSTYSVIGAKILVAFIQMVLIGAAFILLAVLDFSIMMTRLGEFKNFVEVIKYVFTELMHIDIKTEVFILTFILGVLQWFSFITTAMLAITLSSTFLSNSKLKGLISIVLYIMISYISTKLLGIILPDFIEMNVKYLAFASMYTLFVVFLAYLGTSWMLDKKVSV